MTEQEFTALHITHRADLLLRKGKSLNIAIFLDGCIVKLYSFETFFIEVYFLKGNIERVNIANDADLQKYLKDIHIDAL